MLRPEWPREGPLEALPLLLVLGLGGVGVVRRHVDVALRQLAPEEVDAEVVADERERAWT